MRTIIIYLMLLVVVCVLAIAFNSAWIEEDRVACLKWQEEAHEYAGYYLTVGQKAQCDYFGIKVDAPVKQYSDYDN